MSYDVAVVVGSLRKGSWTRRVALTLAEVAPPSLRLSEVEIGRLPLYNQDLETVFLDMPALQMPEVYISNAARLFDDQAGGRMTNDSTREFLAKFAAAFERWITKFVPPK